MLRRIDYGCAATHTESRDWGGDKGSRISSPCCDPVRDNRALIETTAPL